MLIFFYGYVISAEVWMVLLRFAPSPTGALHLGGLRTALLNHLVAKQLRGKWILRIEDTDNTRFVPGSVDNIRKGLDWAGLHYDFGPGIGGPHAPYFQSSRLDLYRSYASDLLAKGHAYRCFCSPTHLEEIKESLKRRGLKDTTYDRSCWHLSEEEVARRVRAGEPHVIRFHDPSAPNRPPHTDLVFGKVADAHWSLPTDPILVKTDLYPTYHLASVVDDIEMGITHILRGEEWLPSLPLHLDIYACFNKSPPHFAHLPLLLNPDGTKMSKRHGDFEVTQYMDQGWEPEAVINWLALVGWGNRTGEEGKKLEHGKSVQDLFSLQELQDKFLLSALTNRRAILYPKTLEYLNKEHIRLKATQPEALNVIADKALGILSSAVPQSQYLSLEYVKSVIIALEGRLWRLNEIHNIAPYFFVEPQWTSDAALKMRGRIPDEKYISSLSQCLKDLSNWSVTKWDHDNLGLLLKGIQQSLKFSSNEIMTPLRYAMTGMKDGPSLTKILEVIGKDRTVERVERCLNEIFRETV